MPEQSKTKSCNYLLTSEIQRSQYFTRKPEYSKTDKKARRHTTSGKRRIV